MYEVIIIGSGVSGLTAAHELQTQGVNVAVLESNNEPGGCLKSIQKNSYLLDIGANSMLPSPEVLNWLTGLGINEKLCPAQSTSKARYLLVNGRYKKLPAGPGQLLFGNFFSWKSKFKILGDLRQKPQNISEETTVDQFARNRFGPQVADYVANPFVRGVYSGDSQQLLLNASFPALAEMVAKHGSLIKGMIRSGGTSRKVSVNFTEGMSTLTQFLAAGIGNIFYNTAATGIEKTPEGTFKLHTQKNETFETKKVIIACGAAGTGNLLAQLEQPLLAEAIANINYSSLSVFHLGYDARLNKLPEGFGGLHPSAEKTLTSGIIRTSNVFEGRAPEGKFLVTAFVPHAPDILPDAEAVIEEVNKLCKFSTQPELVHRHSWPKAIPQYDRQWAEAKKLYNQLLLPGVTICCNIFEGVAVNDCIKNALATARAVATELAAEKKIN